MARSFLGLLLLICSYTLTAFEPPIDLANVEYEEFSQQEKEGKLTGGKIVFTETVSYFNTVIDYSIYFDKNNPEEKHAFFFRPNSNPEAFIEFYKDFLTYYALQAMIIRPYMLYRLDGETEIIHEFYIAGRKKLLIYAKRSNITGFRGFGIVMDHSSETVSEDGLQYLQRLASFYQAEYRDRSEFDPSIFEANDIYIDINLALGFFDEQITYQRSNSEYFGNRWLLNFSQYTPFTIEIDSEDSTHFEYLLLSTSNGQNVVIQELPWKITLSSWSDIIALDLKGKFTGESEEAKISVKIVPHQTQ